MSNIGYLKIALSALILIGALVFSYFSFFSSLPALGDSKKSAAENFIDPLTGIKSPISWQSNQFGGGRSVAGDFLDGQGGQNPAEENNFTENFVQAVQEKVLQAKQGGNFDSSQFQFDLGLIDSISDSKIKISTDNSKEAKKNYLKSLDQSAVENYGDFIKKDPTLIIISVYKDLNPLPAKEAAMIYSQTADDFLAIEVPNDWKDFHKKLIIYFKNGAIIYNAMAQYHKDPIKGYAALNKGPEILINQSVEINKAWQKKYKEIQ